MGKVCEEGEEKWEWSASELGGIGQWHEVQLLGCEDVAGWPPAGPPSCGSWGWCDFWVGLN